MTGRRVSRLVEAREKARARTAERRAREQRLEDLATEWFQTEGEIAEIEAAARRKIDLYAARVRGRRRRLRASGVTVWRTSFARCWR